EFAKIYFERMTRQAKHPDVRAGAKYALLARRDDHAFYFGMLEADAIHRVVEFDIDAEVVGIELQLIARRESAVFVHIHQDRRDRPVEVQTPMPITGGLRSKVDHREILPPGRDALRTV